MHVTFSNISTTTESYIDHSSSGQFTPTFLDFFLAVVIIGLFVALFCGSSCVLLVCFKRIMCRDNQGDNENSRSTPSTFIVEAPPDYSNAALYPAAYSNEFGIDDKEKPPSYDSLTFDNSIAPIPNPDRDRIVGNFPVQV